MPDYGPDRYKRYYVNELGREIIIDTYFLAEDQHKVAFFPLKSSVKLFPDTYVFLLSFHLITLIMAVVILMGEQDYKTSVSVFICLEVIDLMFFVFTYGEPFENIPLRWNVVKIIIFGIAILNEKQRYRQWKK